MIFDFRSGIFDFEFDACVDGSGARVRVAVSIESKIGNQKSEIPSAADGGVASESADPQQPVE